MPEKLTGEEIKEAIEKKHCPYCKNRKFIADFPSWQKFDFNKCDSEGKPFYHDPDTSAAFERVECDNCGEDIPEIIWEGWNL